MIGKSRKRGALLLSAFLICGLVLLGGGFGHAAAAKRCVINQDMLSSALITGSGFTKIAVSGNCPANVATTPLNADGSAVSYISNGTFYMAPKSAGNTIALEGNCYGLFSSYIYYVLKNSDVFGRVTEIDLRGLDVTGVTSAMSMFDGAATFCPSALQKLDLRGLKFSSLTDASSLVRYCEKLTSIQADWAEWTAVTNTSYMFEECGALKTLDLTGLDTSKVTDMSYMFRGCTGMTNIPYAGLSTESLLKASGFVSGTMIESFSFSDFDISHATDVTSFFQGCTKLISVNTSAIDTRNVTIFKSMFEQCESLRSINLSPFRTGNATDLSRMFMQCYLLEKIDCSSFDTSMVTTMASMFQDCRMATSINVSSFNTALVKDFSSMFNACMNLPKIDVRNFNTAKGDQFGFMFNECLALTTIDVRSFNTSMALSMWSMFGDCKGLTTIDCSNFVCNRLRDASEMFAGCENLSVVDLSGFANTSSKGFSMNSMFLGCVKLETVNLIHFTPSASMLANQTLSFTNSGTTISYKFPVSDVFSYCIELKGICMKDQATFNDFVKASGIQGNAVGFHHYDETGTVCTSCHNCGYFISSGEHFFNNNMLDVCPICNACRAVAQLGDHNMVGGVCTYCGYTDGVVEPSKVVGMSLDLNGNIRVNIYAYLNEAVKTDLSSYLLFTYPGNKTVKVLTSEADGRTTVEDKLCYIYQGSIAAKDMTDVITVRIYDGSNNPVSEAVTFSVKEYGETILGSKEDDTTKALVKAMLNYGAYAQKYFGKSGTLANASFSQALPSKVKTIGDVAGYAPTIRSYVSGEVYFSGCSLILEDRIKVRYYFDFDPALSTSKKNAYIQEMRLNPASNGKYYYETQELSITQWGNKIDNEGFSVVVTYCPLSFVHEVMATQPDSQLGDLMRALYAYWAAGQNYLNTH